MRSLACATAALACATAFAWTPPAEPDPSAILKEAWTDTEAGRYADALEKQVWFHEKSLQYVSALGGVRLSFALAQWVELGKRYPPALDALKDVRDRASVRVREVAHPFDAFHEVASIDRALGERARTAELFVWLDANKPQVAKQMYSIAQDSMVAAGNYGLAGKYIDPAAEIDRIVSLHRMTARTQKRDARLSKFAYDSFTNRAAMLVALLAVNGRQAEAEEAAQEFRKELQDEAFDAKLRDAARGAVPAPWP